MRIILLSFLLFALPLLPAIAAEKPLVIEVFTYPSCAPGDFEKYYNPDGTLKEPSDADKKLNQKHIGSIFEEIIAEHPNAIALHYFNDITHHDHDENGNDVPVQTITKELSDFISDRSYLHYQSQNFLDGDITPQMIINGTYAPDGTIKQIADIAITRSQSEQNISPIKLAINGLKIQIELPKSHTDKSITPVLIGYHTKQRITNNRAAPAINPTNMVTSFKKLNPWRGEGRSQTVSIANMNADGFALIAQDEYTGQIYAAGKVERPITLDQ